MDRTPTSTPLKEKIVASSSPKAEPQHSPSGGTSSRRASPRLNPGAASASESAEGSELQQSQQQLLLLRSRPIGSVSEDSNDSLATGAVVAVERERAKQWKRAMQGVLRTALHHKNGHLFAQPVTDEIAPGHSEIVYKPRSLADIRRDLDAGALHSTEEVRHALQLMFANAIMYNNADHDVHLCALSIYDDLMRQLEVRIRVSPLTKYAYLVYCTLHFTSYKQCLSCICVIIHSLN